MAGEGISKVILLEWHRNIFTCIDKCVPCKAQKAITPVFQYWWRQLDCPVIFRRKHFRNDNTTSVIAWWEEEDTLKTCATSLFCGSQTVTQFQKGRLSFILNSVSPPTCLLFNHTVTALFTAIDEIALYSKQVFWVWVKTDGERYMKITCYLKINPLKNVPILKSWFCFKCKCFSYDRNLQIRELLSKGGLSVLFSLL